MFRVLNPVQSLDFEFTQAQTASASDSLPAVRIHTISSARSKRKHGVRMHSKFSRPQLAFHGFVRDSRVAANSRIVQMGGAVLRDCGPADSAELGCSGETPRRTFATRRVIMHSPAVRSDLPAQNHSEVSKDRSCMLLPSTLCMSGGSTP